MATLEERKAIELKKLNDMRKAMEAEMKAFLADMDIEEIIRNNKKAA